MLTELYDSFVRPRLWRGLDAPPSPAEDHEVETADGEVLRLRHVAPQGPEVDAPPVMLLHGLAANHRAFHLRERSLAEWLAGRGHDVWLPELRGHGASTVAGYDWRLDDYLREDLPAILEAMREHTGEDSVQWVGHSMGGVLLFCYGILEPDNPVERGVTIGSALDYSVGETGFRRLLELRPIIERFDKIPYGELMYLLAPALGRAPGAPESFNVWPSNIEDEVMRAVHARCFHDIPTSLLTSLATTFESRGLRLASGFSFLDHTDRFRIPVRLVGGSRDAQVSPEALAWTADALAGPAEVTIHGPERGDAEHYGHWDLLVGRRAPAETWPEIADWLEQTT